VSVEPVPLRDAGQVVGDARFDDDGRRSGAYVERKLSDLRAR
jgi:hypothetical protein